MILNCVTFSPWMRFSGFWELLGIDDEEGFDRIWPLRLSRTSPGSWGGWRRWCSRRRCTRGQRSWWSWIRRFREWFWLGDFWPFCFLNQSWMLDWSSSLGFEVLKDSLKFQSRITLEFFCIKFSIYHSRAITQSKMASSGPWRRELQFAIWFGRCFCTQYLLFNIWRKLKGDTATSGLDWGV